MTDTVIWLSNHKESSVPIHWISTSLSDAKAGDLLLFPGTLLDHEVIRDAIDKKVSAILGFGKPARLIKESLEGLIVGYINKPKLELRDCQRQLLVMLINERAALIERGTQIHARLSQLEAEGLGLQALVDTMSEITGKGVIVQDKRGQVLAQKSSSAVQKRWDDLLQSIVDLNSLPPTFLNRKQSANMPVIIQQSLGSTLTRLISPIIVGEVARGYLSMIAPHNELDSLDRLVTENGVLVCAIDMARNKAIRETEKRLKGDLLSAILQENLTPRDAALWLQSMGLDISQSHVALRFSWEGSATPSRRRLETIINGEISRFGLKAIVHPMGSEVICFCQIDDKSSRPDIALTLGKTVHDQAAAEYPDTAVRCGIGTSAKTLDDWHSSFSRAGQALDLARRLREAQPLYYSDLSIYRLLFQLEHNPELIAFEEEIIGEILSNDSADELIHTLEAFFKHNGNLSQTSEALYIHRNTLIYRLERIATITKLNLDKPENRLAIQLALHIHRMTAPISI